MPSILKVGDRRVLRYFNKHGFENIRLTFLIMDNNSTLEQVLSLEQYYIDNLPTSLNVDRLAQSTGYHTPMSDGMRLKLRLERGTQVFIYDADTMVFLYMFDSKQHLYTMLKIHHKTISNCILSGTPYKGIFIFSLEPLTTLIHDPILLDKLILSFREVQSPRFTFYAENTCDSMLSGHFSSLSTFCAAIPNADRTTVRMYIDGTKKGLYRSVWKFTRIVS